MAPGAALRPAGSGGQALAAAGPAGGENLAAADSGHARPESVAVLADELARLIGPFHVSSPAGPARAETPVGDCSQGPGMQEPSALPPDGHLAGCIVDFARRSQCEPPEIRGLPPEADSGHI